MPPALLAEVGEKLCLLMNAGEVENTTERFTSANACRVLKSACETQALSENVRLPFLQAAMMALWSGTIAFAVPAARKLPAIFAAHHYHHFP